VTYPSSDTPRPSRRRDEVAQRNDHVAASARRYRFDVTTRLPLICECDDELCSEFVRISLIGYDHARAQSTFIVAPGHESGRRQLTLSGD
jgi:hypothetical protein